MCIRDSLNVLHLAQNSCGIIDGHGMTDAVQQGVSENGGGVFNLMENIFFQVNHIKRGKTAKNDNEKNGETAGDFEL